jgi:hypothetical protein
MITIETKRGDAVRQGERLVVPLSRSVSARFPGGSGGFVWNRPLGVVVEQGGERTFHRIADPTRRFQWLLFGAGAAIGTLLRIARRRRRRASPPLLRRRA